MKNKKIACNLQQQPAANKVAMLADNTITSRRQTPNIRNESYMNEMKFHLNTVHLSLQNSNYICTHTPN